LNILNKKTLNTFSLASLALGISLVSMIALSRPAIAVEDYPTWEEFVCEQYGEGCVDKPWYEDVWDWVKDLLP
jgi:hypothetical protein